MYTRAGVYKQAGICQQELQGEKPQIPVCAHSAQPLSKTTSTCSSALPDDGVDSAHVKQPNFSHTSTHAFPCWFWQLHRETSQPSTFTPVHQALLYIAPDIKTKKRKSPWRGSPPTQLASPCAFRHHYVIETLNFFGPKSRVISCSKVSAVSHTATSTRLLPTASKCQKVAQSFFCKHK